MSGTSLATCSTMTELGAVVTPPSIIADCFALSRMTFLNDICHPHQTLALPSDIRRCHDTRIPLLPRHTNIDPAIAPYHTTTRAPIVLLGIEHAIRRSRLLVDTGPKVPLDEAVVV